jgi:hypothetical protein
MRIFTAIPVLIMITVILISCGSENNGSYYFTAEAIKRHPDPEQLKEILKRDPDTVFNRLILGKERFIQLYYGFDSSEFRFKDGKLSEIIIHKPTLQYDPKSILQFGLPFVSPTDLDTVAFFRWRDIYDGFEVINFYLVGSSNDGQKTSYKIYLKLK